MQILTPAIDDIKRAADLLRAGGLVAFPTETVYGLGADACNDLAVAGIFEAKGRPRFNPLIAHVASLEKAQELADFSDTALSLAARFWPGPVTFVLPLRAESGLSPLVTAGLDSVALRVPAAGIAHALLHAFNGPVAAPSANRSGGVSPTRAAHVERGLGDRIDAILDGGACGVGVESTILDLTGEPALLRPGGLAVEEIEAYLGQPLATPLRSKNGPKSPGQLQSHYAPAAPVRLEVTNPRDDEVLLGFGDVTGSRINLSPAGDLVEAAANLFRALHELDMTGAPIAVSPIPETGLGRAINDRLRRAAAPRDPLALSGVTGGT